jgi:hypothetical protein
MTRPVRLVAAGLVLSLTGLVAGCGADDPDGSDPAESAGAASGTAERDLDDAQAIADEAMANLAEVDGLRVELSDVEEALNGVSTAEIEDSGESVAATFVSDDRTVEFLIVGDRAYMRTDEESLRAGHVPPAQARRYADSWLTGSNLPVATIEAFTIDGLVEQYRSNGVGELTAEETEHDGEPAILLSGDGGDLLVAGDPLLPVQIRAVAPPSAGGSGAARPTISLYYQDVPAVPAPADAENLDELPGPPRG